MTDGPRQRSSTAGSSKDAAGGTESGGGVALKKEIGLVSACGIIVGKWLLILLPYTKDSNWHNCLINPKTHQRSQTGYTLTWCRDSVTLSRSCNMPRDIITIINEAFIFSPLSPDLRSSLMLRGVQGQFVDSRDFILTQWGGRLPCSSI